MAFVCRLKLLRLLHKDCLHQIIDCSLMVSQVLNNAGYVALVLGYPFIVFSVLLMRSVPDIHLDLGPLGVELLHHHASLHFKHGREDIMHLFLL